MKMKILITGSGGFIGNYLAQTFLNQGYSVTATYRNVKPTLTVPSVRRLKSIALNLNEGCKNMGRADVVIHAAAAHPTALPEPGVNDYVQSNVLATLNLAEYFKKNPPNFFVFLSSVDIYGTVTQTRLREDALINNPNIYGFTKNLSENILKNYTQYFPVLSIRLPGVVGFGNRKAWVGRVFENLTKSKPAAIYNPDALFNNVIHVADIARFISSLPKKHLVKFDAVNLAASGSMQIKEIVESMKKMINSKSKITVCQNSRKSYTINIAKLEKKFGFRPESVKHTIDRYVSENQSERC